MGARIARRARDDDDDDDDDDERARARVEGVANVDDVVMSSAMEGRVRPTDIVRPTTPGRRRRLANVRARARHFARASRVAADDDVANRRRDSRNKKNHFRFFVAVFPHDKTNVARAHRTKAHESVGVRGDACDLNSISKLSIDDRVRKERVRRKRFIER